MSKISIEFKVGVFVLIAIIILAVIIFQIGGINIFSGNMYKLCIIFDFVSGIEVDAPVHVAGVSVGLVKDVEIFYNPKENKTQVRVELALKKDVRISKDSVAYINTLGILGEKYVEIVPGEDRVNFLNDGGILVGHNPVRLEKLTESLVDIVGDQTVRDSLRQSFYNARQTTENLLATSEALNEVMAGIKNGQGTIGRFVNDDSIYVETEKMIVNLNEKLDKTITDLNNELNSLVQDLKKHPWKLFRKPPRQPKSAASSAKKLKKRSSSSGSNKGVIYKKK